MQSNRVETIELTEKKLPQPGDDCGGRGDGAAGEGGAQVLLLKIRRSSAGSGGIFSFTSSLKPILIVR